MKLSYAPVASCSLQVQSLVSEVSLTVYRYYGLLAIRQKYVSQNGDNSFNSIFRQCPEILPKQNKEYEIWIKWLSIYRYVQRRAELVSFLPQGGNGSASVGKVASYLPINSLSISSFLSAFIRLVGAAVYPSRSSVPDLGCKCSVVKGIPISNPNTGY